MASSLTVNLHSERSELLRLSDAVDAFGAEHHISDDHITNVNLVLDEIVSNVIKYGGVSAGESIEVSLKLDGERLTISVSDDGIAFNPLVEAKEPDLDLPLIERPVGGLGIHIVKTLAETIGYERENGRNRLTLTMLIGPLGAAT